MDVGSAGRGVYPSKRRLHFARVDRFRSTHRSMHVLRFDPFRDREPIPATATARTSPIRPSVAAASRRTAALGSSNSPITTDGSTADAEKPKLRQAACRMAGTWSRNASSITSPAAVRRIFILHHAGQRPHDVVANANVAARHRDHGSQRRKNFLSPRRTHSLIACSRTTRRVSCIFRIKSTSDSPRPINSLASWIDQCCHSVAPDPINRAQQFRFGELGRRASTVEPSAGINDQHTSVGVLDHIGGMELGACQRTEIRVGSPRRSRPTSTIPNARPSRC